MLLAQRQYVSDFDYEFPYREWSVCRQPFRIAGWRFAMGENLGVDDEGCGRLQFELPFSRHSAALAR